MRFCSKPPQILYSHNICQQIWRMCKTSAAEWPQTEQNRAAVGVSGRREGLLAVPALQETCTVRVLRDTEPAFQQGTASHNAKKKPNSHYVVFKHLQISFWKFSVVILVDRKCFLFFSLKWDQSLCWEKGGKGKSFWELNLSLSVSGMPQSAHCISLLSSQHGACFLKSILQKKLPSQDWR